MSLSIHITTVEKIYVCKANILLYNCLLEWLRNIFELSVSNHFRMETLAIRSLMAENYLHIFPSIIGCFH